MVEPDKTITEEHPKILVYSLISFVISIFLLGMLLGAMIMGVII